MSDLQTVPTDAAFQPEPGHEQEHKQKSSVTPVFLDDISPVAASTRPSECGGDSEKRRLADGGPKRDYRGWADRGKDALIERLWRRKRGSS